MKRILKVLGLVMVVGILTAALAGTALAAGPTDNGTQTQTQNQGAVCSCDECPRGDGVCDGSNCTPNLWGGSGPHGARSGK